LTIKFVPFRRRQRKWQQLDAWNSGLENNLTLLNSYLSEKKKKKIKSTLFIDYEA